MKTTSGKWAMVVAGTLLAVAMSGAFAQGRQQGGPATQGRAPQGAMGGMQDRGRTMDRGQPMDRDRQRLRDQEMDRIYGRELMTDAERAEYHERLRTLATERERIEYRLEHHRLMQERAKQRGIELPPAPIRSRLADQERARQRERANVYGYQLMDQAELERYRERLREARSQQERDRIRAEHRKTMQKRAQERGITLADTPAAS